MVIQRNREALRRILAMLMAMAGFDVGERGSPTLPRLAHRAVLRLLRPAESAARRLVIVAARGLTVELAPRPAARPVQTGTSAFLRKGVGTGIILPRGVSVASLRGETPRARTYAFPLLDPLTRPGPPRLRTARDTPRIVFFGPGARPPARLRPPCLPGDLLDARRLVLRLAALSAALDDLPGQARRFARWQARAAAYARERQAAAAQSPAAGTRHGGGRPARFRRSSPFRPGRPPGQKSPKNPRRGEVHEILADLHYFAVEALERPDTS
nr:hypothetical protein [Mesorhizobium sp.]